MTAVPGLAILSFALLALLLAGTTPLTASASSLAQMRFRYEWTYLGEAALTPQRDYERVTARPYLRTFRDLQIRVRKQAVHFWRIRIHFADGEVLEVPFEHVLPARGVSRTIDLMGDRSVESIELWYDAASLEGEASILLYGRG